METVALAAHRHAASAAVGRTAPSRATAADTATTGCRVAVAAAARAGTPHRTPCRQAQGPRTGARPGGYPLLIRPSAGQAGVTDAAPSHAGPSSCAYVAAPHSLRHAAGQRGDATRRAIQLAARAPLLSERAGAATQDPGRENAQQRFGREVASSAYGNCLKGEFPGGGGGLPSLPFWLAAEVSGKCKK